MPHSLTRDDILTALATITGPSGEDIVSEGSISAITIRGGTIGFILTCPPDHAAPLQAQCERTLLSFPGVEKVTVVTTFHNDAYTGKSGPNDATASSRSGGVESRQREGAEPPVRAEHAPQKTKTPLPHVRHIIAVASGKGGVGKSTITILLAHALTQLGHRVAICDADIYGPSVPRMLGLPLDQPAFAGGLMRPFVAYGIRANSIAFITGESAAIMRGPMVSKSLHQLLRGTDWSAHLGSREREEAQGADHAAKRNEGGERSEGRPGVLCTPTLRSALERDAPLVSEANQIDYLLLDMPPGTGDVQLSLLQSLELTGALLLTTPQEVSVIDARKAGAMFRKLDVPILGIIENMSGFTDPTGAHHAIFGCGGGQSLAEAFGETLLGQLPLDPAIGVAMDKGKAPPAESPVMQEMTRLAARLAKG